MILTEKQEKLLDFVKGKHDGQKRKYTGNPYWNHLVHVAEIVNKYNPNLIEIALCHDILEDTNCKEGELAKQLLDIGYDSLDIITITDSVIELTDKYTKDNYPNLNRGKRKLLEAKRLGSISYYSQTVKYADLIDNTKSITKYDHKFAKIYLKEKENTLRVMRNGDERLLEICEKQLYKAINDLRNL
jgi:guanosine-3',5'-bis(diphosphate) 3'-pyrophosphohydrolase